MEHHAHCLNGRTVGFVLLASAEIAASREGCSLGDADEFEGKVAIGALSVLRHRENLVQGRRSGGMRIGIMRVRKRQ